MVMLPTLLIIGAPAKLVLWGERVGIDCPMSQGDSLARDCRTRWRGFCGWSVEILNDYCYDSDDYYKHGDSCYGKW